MRIFSRFRGRDKEGDGVTSPRSKKKAHLHTNGAIAPAPPSKPLWEGDPWTRKEVEPEEIQELLRGCTSELKSKALDLPFLLLPFRPASDPSAARTFIRNFFSMERGAELKGERLEQELMLTEPMVLTSVVKWCWSRLTGGVVTWEAYELFKVGEQDSEMARDAFATFIPLSVESDARTKIIFDFFDLMAAIAAHWKANGMGGRKLSRLAGWWAFEQIDAGNGFDGGYRSWSSAADATSHLFFAYLRSLSPESVRGFSGISTLPLSLQTLLEDTQYPPAYPPFETTSKVVMVVNSVSPTPFALLRRAKHFEYRDDDQVLQQFSDFEDPVQALTVECRRVLNNISSANQSSVSNIKTSTSLGDASWSRFEDIGFTGLLGEHDDRDEPDSVLGRSRTAQNALKSAPQSRSHDHGRPTTPSWADFLSSGFVEESSSPAQAPLFLPPDKILPPIDLDGRAKSSQSHKPALDKLDPGELASINAIDLDDAFWWVWITSLAGEETTARKSVFGRCALIETDIHGGTWLVIEEMVKGAAPEPEVGSYIAEKKGRFTFAKRRTMSRTKTLGRKPITPQMDPFLRSNQSSQTIKTGVGPDQHARIQAAAAVLQQKQKQQEAGEDQIRISPRRGRGTDGASTKTNSVFTLQPVIMSEAGPALKWANTYDKIAIRDAYLGNFSAGKGGSATDLGAPGGKTVDKDPSVKPQPPMAKDAPKPDYGFPKQREQSKELHGPESGIDTDRSLPPLPAATPGESTMRGSTISPPAVPVPPAPLPVANHMPSGPPPPAPLPVNPEGIEGRLTNTVVADAAQVPLPAATPIQPVEKLSSPAQDEESKPTWTMTGHQPNGSALIPSLESRKDVKKLRKQQGSYKGFFGRKKGPALPATPPPADSTAVAAARAAYVGPQMKPNYIASASSTSLSRRFSGIGRKKMSPVSGPTSPPIADEEEPPPLPPAPFKAKYESEASPSNLDGNEEGPPNREVHKFNQGPLDQPAFVPADDAHNSPRVSFVAEGSTDAPSRLTTPDKGAYYPPPIGHGEYEPSVSTEERPPSSPMPVSAPVSEQPTQTDRWAQIRKNAAERAARASEEKKSGVSHDKVEDGEESGEETIESRVARIKARVAELTGNMQSEPSRPRD